MEIIFNNLISNAIKYNKTGGTIEINLIEESGKTIIKVKDSGIGINEENLRELFKDFMRIKSDQTRNISGSGLGLSIVKKIVDLNNGEISVESKLNEGSTFKVVLPV